MAPGPPKVLNKYVYEITLNLQAIIAGDDSVIILAKRDKNIKNRDMAMIYKEDIAKYDVRVCRDALYNSKGAIFKLRCKGGISDRRGSILTVWDEGGKVLHKFTVDPTTNNYNC